MNWKSYVEKKNAKTFVLPPGWDSRDDIAEQLECSPEKVKDHLRPSLKSGEVEEGVFPVWDSALGRLVRVIAYREKSKGDGEAQPVTAKDVIEMRSGGLSWPEIGAKLGITAEAARSKYNRARSK